MGLSRRKPRDIALDDRPVLAVGVCVLESEAACDSRIARELHDGMVGRKVDPSNR